MLHALHVLALGEFDDAFHDPVDQLISHIAQHDFSEHRYKRGHDEQGNIKNVGKHFLQVLDPGPTFGTVGIGSGHGQRAPVG
ncbi:hypothetical protein D3C76_1065960 [compost metagenome]